MVAFDSEGKAGDLLEWILDDEIHKKGRTLKKVQDNLSEQAEGKIRAGPLMLPVMKDKVCGPKLSFQKEEEENT